MTETAKGVASAAADAPAASPYQGLRPYEEADAALFFGREAEGENVEANLFSDRLTLLYGPSGVGKSSVLLAGVAGSLRKRSRDDLADGAAAGFAVIVVRSWSDADPLQTIAAATRAEVMALLDRDDLPDPPAGATLAEVLDHWCGEVRGKLLLLFDQFEEYFLYHGQESGPGTFDREFPQAVNRADLRANFLLSIRDDALAQLDRFKGRIPGLFDNRLQIDHLGLDAARDAVTLPIKEYNRHVPHDHTVEIEDELVDNVLDQVRTDRVSRESLGAGALREAGVADARIETPILQVVLTALWEREAELGSRTLRAETLRDLGGAAQLLGDRLNERMRMLDREEQEIAANIARFLVTPSGTKIALTAADLSQLAYEKPDLAAAATPRVESVLQKLAEGDTRILRPVAPQGGKGATRYEIFHDVLGGALVDWRSRYMREQERLELERRAVAEREQLEQEKREAEQREQVERRRARTFRAVAGVALALLVVACSILAYALVQKGRAEHAQRVSGAQALAAQARTALGDGRLGTAIPQALAAYDQAPATAAAQDALVDAIQQATGLRRVDQFGAPVGGTAVAPGGGAIAVSAGGKVVLRDGRGATVASATEPADVGGVAFSPSGAQLAAARTDGTVALYRVRSDGRGRATALERLRLLPTGAVSARAVAFSSDGRWLAAATGDGVVVWRLGTRAAPRLLQPAAEARAVAFCPGRHGRGPAVVAAFDDGRVVLWPSPAARARRPVVLGAQPQSEGAVACSPDGLTLAAAGDDRIVTLFRLDGSAPPARLGGHTDGIESLAFSGDGRLLASGADDHSVILWDVRRERELGRRLLAHTQPVVSVGFDPRGATLAAGSGDGSVSVWDAAELARSGGGVEVTRRDPVHDASFGGGVFAAATSGARVLVRDAALEPGRAGRVPEAEVGANEIAVDPGAGWIALGFKKGVGLYRLRGGVPDAHEQPLAGATEVETTGFARGIALARDGRLAAALPGGAIRLWGAPPRTRSFVDLRPPGRPGSACALAIAPDGRTVAAAYAYGGACGQRGVRGGQVVLWRGSERPVVLPGALGDVGDVEFGPGGTLAAAGTHAIGVWDVETGRLRESLPAGADTVAFNADGRWLASSSGADGSVRLWDVAARRQMGDPLPMPPHVGAAALAFTAPSTLAAAYQDGTAAVWDLSSWRIATRLDTIARSLRRAIGEWRRLTVRSQRSTIGRPRGGPKPSCPAAAGS